MSSEKVKKNPDYSASAINLTNPPEVKDLLLAQKNRLFDLSKLQEKIDACIPLGLQAELECLQNEITTEDKGIRGYIDTFGSFQDVERGLYAIKQRKLSVSYDAASFESHYPELAPAVLVKSVNIKAIEGLVKGGLLDKACLEAEDVIKVSESFAYIIKTS